MWVHNVVGDGGSCWMGLKRGDCSKVLDEGGGELMTEKGCLAEGASGREDTAETSSGK
jgi:hypothetical protein